jgi:UDP-N-acetylmuramoylalanine--D-glutamate ligase
MNDRHYFKNKSYGVLGLGKFGLATALFLQRKGAVVKAWDDDASVRLKAAEQGLIIQDVCQNEERLEGIFPSPGVPLYGPLQHPWVSWALQHNIPLINDIDVFRQLHPEAFYIGITGTNGKSTTTMLVKHLLQVGGKVVQAGGNLGTPAFQLNSLKKGEYYIFELSSYNLDLLQEAVFDIGIFLNLTPDHLKRHGTMDRYYQAKMRLFSSSHTYAVMGIDDSYTHSAYHQLSNPKVAISVKEKCEKGVYVHEGYLWHSLKDVPQKMVAVETLETLRGEHNWQNAAAGVAVALLIGMDEATIIEGLKTFPGIPHRQELVQTIGEVFCINDSKATSVEAAKRALQSYNDIYWILGGEAKDDDLEDLSAYFHKVKHAFIIGEAVTKFSNILQKNGVPFTISEALPVAVPQALEKALKEGKGTVLLSPACTSWDQFKNFEERGACFITAIDQYQRKEKDRFQQ